jgi:hypothetical protein
MAKIKEKDACLEEKKSSSTKQKVIWYIDEFAVLLLSILAVVGSDAVMKRAKGQKVVADDVFTDWLNVGISALLAIVSYGTMYTKIRYNDSAKPPFIKRAANAILQGVAWRTIFGWTDK